MLLGDMLGVRPLQRERLLRSSDAPIPRPPLLCIRLFVFDNLPGQVATLGAPMAGSAILTLPD